MSVAELLKKKSRFDGHRIRSKIEINKPIVNFFIGNCKTADDNLISMIKNCIEERVGETTKIHYCHLYMRDSDAQDINGVTQIRLPEIELNRDNIILRRNETIRQALNSQELHAILFPHIAEACNSLLQQNHYSRAGQIRLNFIFNSDEFQACMMYALAMIIRDGFNRYFPEGVMVDVYCMLDQKVNNDIELRRDIEANKFLLLKDLQSLVINKYLKMAYILSNYSDKQAIEDINMNKRCECIVLNMLMKDGISAVGPNGIREFYEDEFINAAVGEGLQNKGFFTIGHCEIDNDRYVRDLVVYKTILQDLCNEKYASIEQLELLKASIGIDKDVIEREFNNLQSQMSIFMSDQVIRGIPRDRSVSAGSFLNYNNKDMIKKLYGNNLEFFWKRNTSYFIAEYEKKAKVIINDIETKVKMSFQNGEMSFGDVIAVMNDYLTFVESELLKYQDQYNASVAEKNSFEESKTEGAGKKTSYNEDDAFYLVARNYFKIMKNIDSCKIIEELLQYIRMDLKSFKQKYDILLEQLKNDMQEISNEIESYSLADNSEITDLLYGNIERYYSRITTDLILKDASKVRIDFDRWKKNELCRVIVEGSLDAEAVISTVMLYCDENILTQSEYDQDFSDEIKARLLNYSKRNLVSENDVFAFAFATIKGQRMYYCSQVTTQRIYNDLCFFVNPKNKLVDATNEIIKTHLAELMPKGFFERDYSGMKVIFLQGVFEPESIHQFTLYQNSYQELIHKK